MTDRTQLLTTSTNTNNISSQSIDGGSTSSNQNYGTIPTQPEMDDNKTTLKFFHKIGFALGHVSNDMHAALWFSYTLLFFQGVLGLSAVLAGSLVMIGQIGDAIATPLVGWISDRFLTKRKFHIIGSLLTSTTFPLIFAICPFCDIFPTWWKFFYFSIVILIFQFGWPTVQITHLAMIPELSRTKRDRSLLTATRYSASIVANVVVYVVTWVVLHLQSSLENKITPNDWPKFRDIALILTIIGVSMTVLFHFSLSLSGYEYRRNIARNQNLPSSRETESLIRNQPADEPSTSQQIDPPEVVIKYSTPKKNFFRSPLLYQNALLYVFSRLFMTTSLVYMPLWLNERAYSPPNSTVTDGSSIENIASIPLASFIASFVASNLYKHIDRFIGHNIGYLIGSVISFVGCFWVALAATPTSSVVELYIVAALFGAGSSISMITSLCITADLIGNNSDQGGFIYSAVTFCDKLISGIVIVMIESIKCQNVQDCPTYYRNVLSIACGVPAICGILTLLSMICTKSWSDRVEREEQRRLSRQ